MKKTMRTIFCFLLVICTLVFLVSCLDGTGAEKPGTTTAADGTTDPSGSNGESNSNPCSGDCSYEQIEILKAPTCTEAGKEKVKCSVCGQETERDLPATGNHEAGEWEEILAATRYAEGKRVKKCKTCDLEMQTEVIARDLDVDLSSYSVIYDAGVGRKFFLESVTGFAKDAGLSQNMNSDSKVTKDNAAQKEILIGETDRPESAAALALLNTEGFAITYTDGKIAIVGTNPAQTICGVNYFTEKYLDGSGKAADLPDSEVKANSEKELISSAGFGHTLVFDDALDNEEGTPFGYNSGDARDYTCIAVDNIITNLSDISGLNKNSIPKKTDNLSTSSKELIVGNVNRAEYAEFANTLDANEYGICVKGDKVILAAWNNKAMGLCVEEFKNLLKEVRISSGGLRIWRLPDGFFVKCTADDSWETDFPRPDEATDINLSKSLNANNSSLQYLYTGSGVSATAFEAYCQKLVDAGYTMRTTNTIENSIFRLYVNEAKGIVLNVAYNDYKHESTYFSATKKAEEGKYYLDYEKCIKVTSSPLDAITIPDSTLTTIPTYTKVCESTITDVGLKGDATGMSYIVRLEDGRFIVYDGGNNCPSDPSGRYTASNGYTDNDEVADLWKALSKLHQDATGAAPSASNPIRIAAWVITHSHGDHFAVCRDFISTYGANDAFRLEYLIGTFPTVDNLYATGGINNDIITLGKLGGFESWQAKVTNGGEGTFKFLKAFSGQKLYFANVEMEILMTYEDHPSSIYNENETSTVTRLSIRSTNAVKTSSVTFSASGHTTTALFLGDSLRYQSRYLCNMYGGYLRSDMVQMAHHGNVGCEIELYETVAPKTVLWPHWPSILSKWANQNATNPDYFMQVDIFVRYELASVKYIYLSDVNYALTLKLTSNGPDYDNIYDAYTGNALRYNSGSTPYAIRKVG